MERGPGSGWVGPVVAAVSVVVVAAAIAGWLASTDDDEAGAAPRLVPVGHLCTLIGCGSGASVTVKHIERDYPQIRRMLFCVEELCTVQRIDRGRRFNGASLAPDFGGSKALVDVELILLGPLARTVHRVRYEGRAKPEYPNGRSCDKGCLRLDLYYDADSDALARPPN